MRCSAHSVLVITAKQLQRHFVLLRQGPGSAKQFGAIKVVEVISYDHLNSSGTAHGSIDSLEGSDWTLVACLTWGDFQFHIIHLITFDNVSNVMVLTDECSINGTLNAQLLRHRFGVTIEVGVGLTDSVNIQIVILDHVKVIFIRERSVHLTVQLLEIILDGVRGQCVIVIFTEVMVASEGINVSSVV